MGDPRRVPQTPCTLGAPRRSRGAPRPPVRSGHPGGAVAPLDPLYARGTPAEPWRPSTPCTLGAPRRSRGAAPCTVGVPRRSRGVPRPPVRSGHRGGAVAPLDPPCTLGVPRGPVTLLASPATPSLA